MWIDIFFFVYIIVTMQRKFLKNAKKNIIIGFEKYFSRDKSWNLHSLVKIISKSHNILLYDTVPRKN